MKKSSNLSVIGTLLFVIVLVVIAIGSTYAYYTLNIVGTPSKSTITAGKLVINSNLDSVAVINNIKLPLMDATEKNTKAEKVEFYIKNESTNQMKADYFVYITALSLSKNFYSEYLKWELVKSDGTIINSGDFSTAKRVGSAASGEADNVITTAENLLLNKTDSEGNAIGLRLNNGNTDDLIFRLWLENDPEENQISLLNGSFSGKLYFEAVPVK